MVAISWSCPGAAHVMGAVTKVERGSMNRKLARISMAALAKYLMAAILVGWMAFAGQSKADSVIYTNGPISFLGDAFSISYTTSVSDSFTVSSPATLTEAEIG